MQQTIEGKQPEHKMDVISAASLGDINQNLKDQEESLYSADYINILLLPLNSQQIKVYPATISSKIALEKIVQQTERYAIIPVNVNYDGYTNPNSENHWPVVIVDKINKNIFYLDSAQKTGVPQEVENLKRKLNYNNDIIFNPIDFQKNEKGGKSELGLIHCGAYMAEICFAFEEIITQNKSIVSDKPQKNTTTVSIFEVLKSIPVAEDVNAASIKEIRQAHAAKVKANLEKAKLEGKAPAEMAVVLPRPVATKPLPHATQPTPFPAPKVLKTKSEDAAKERAKQNIGFAYHQLLEVVHKFDEKIEANWRQLNNILAEIKTSENAFSVTAGKVQELLIKIINKKDPETNKSVISEEENMLLIKAIAMFGILAKDLDPFPEITVTQIGAQAKADPATIISILKAFDQNIYKEGNIFEKRIECCMWIALHYEEITILANRVFPAEKNGSALGISAPFQRLIKYRQLSDELIKFLEPLGQSLELMVMIKKIDSEFKSYAGNIDLLVESSQKVDSHRQSMKLSAPVNPSGSNNYDAEEQTIAQVVRSKRSLRGKPEQKQPNNSDDQPAVAILPPAHMPPPLVKVTATKENIARPLNYADKILKATPENPQAQQLSEVVKSLQSAVSELGDKAEYFAADFEKLRGNLKAIKSQMDDQGISVPNDATIQKMCRYLDNPILASACVQLFEFVEMYDDGSHLYLLSFMCKRLHDFLSSDNGAHKKQALEDVWKAFYVIQFAIESIGIHYSFFDAKKGYQPLHQGHENLSFAQELFNAVFYILAEPNVHHGALLNLHGVLSKQVENDIPNFSSNLTEDNFMDILDALPNPPTRSLPNNAKIEVYALQHNAFDALIMGMAANIVAGKLDENQHAQHEWVKLFNANKINGKEDWKFSEIKDYFANLDTYQTQREMQIKFAEILRAEAVKLNTNSSYKNDTSGIQTAFTEYFNSLTTENSQIADNVFLRCPDVKSYFDQICQQPATNNKSMSVQVYFEYLKKNSQNISLPLDDLCKQVGIEWKKNLADKFIAYTANSGTLVGLGELMLVCEQYGFQDISGNLSTEDGFHWVYKDPEKNTKKRDAKNEWMKKAPSPIYYQLAMYRTQGVNGAYWPSMHDQVLRVKVGEVKGENGRMEPVFKRSNWRLVEPESNFIKAENIALGLVQKINQKNADSKFVRMVENSLIDLFKKYHSQQKDLPKGEFNEELRSAYESYKSFMTQGVNFTLSDIPNKNTVISWYLTHVADGLLPLTDKLVAAWAAASYDQPYVIWKKEVDGSIRPCASSLSKKAHIPSVHILQTKDKDGNTIFKKMEAELITHYLKHAPVHNIVESRCELDWGSPVPFAKDEKFYSWHTLRLEIEHLLHLLTRDRDDYAAAPYLGTKYSDDIHERRALIEVALHKAIRSLEMIARARADDPSGRGLAFDLLGELQGHKKDFDRFPESKIFSLYVEKYRLLWKAFQKVKDLAFVGPAQNDDIDAAKRLITQAAGRVYHDPFEKQKIESGSYWPTNLKPDTAEHVVLNSNLPVKFFIVTNYPDGRTEYGVYFSNGAIEKDVRADVTPSNVRMGITSVFWLFASGLLGYGGYLLGYKAAQGTGDRETVDLLEGVYCAGAVILGLGLWYFCYNSFVVPYLWNKENFIIDEGHDPHCYRILYTENANVERDQEAYFSAAGLTAVSNTPLSQQAELANYQTPSSRDPQNFAAKGTAWRNIEALLDLITRTENLNLEDAKALAKEEILPKMDQLKANPQLISIEGLDEMKGMLELLQKFVITGSDGVIQVQNMQAGLGNIQNPLDLLGALKQVASAINGMVEAVRGVAVEARAKPPGKPGANSLQFNLDNVKVTDGSDQVSETKKVALQQRFDTFAQNFENCTPAAQSAILVAHKETIETIKTLLQSSTPVSAKKLGDLLGKLEEDNFIKHVVAGSPVSGDVVKKPQNTGIGQDTVIDLDGGHSGEELNALPNLKVVNDSDSPAQLAAKSHFGSPVHNNPTSSRQTPRLLPGTPGEKTPLVQQPPTGM